MPVYSIEDVSPVLPNDFYWIASNATVIGNVSVGEDVGIWFGAVIRGDTESIIIGAQTNIQENSVLHADPGYPINIGKGCTIGHKAMLHGCTIGNNSLIGMNATVLNGAKIGNNCLIGAGALVPEGKIIPNNSLVVGMPGKVIRTLDEAAIQKLKASAKRYLQNAKRFANNLKQL
ncbi:MAG: gamma carbonic anhydrase family protein [Rhizobiales bacterium]|nr:gamma carbonic anhydrase family protein [Hyphomicrobiales bacterium]